LFPASDVRRLCMAMHEAGARACYHELASAHGHDAFLADPNHLAPIISEALEAKQAAAKKSK
jgi:homoserine O-acetyltransferase